MCTLTYLPLPGNEFIITSNRDESPDRARAKPPVEKEIAGRKVVFPADGLAGGTWIAVADNRKTVCLLNGAFGQHPWIPPYRLSRGLMVLQSLEFNTTAAFYDHYDFEGTEPFTYLCFEVQGNTAISELRWDGKKKHVKNIDASQPAIWSSAQLYSTKAIKQREEWFARWLQENEQYTAEAINDFHHFGGEGNIYNDIVMNRQGMVQTISITSVNNTASGILMRYEDLLTGDSGNISLRP